MIELKKAVKEFKKIKVLDNYDLKIDEGDFCIIYGPSGCGKSTLLNIISGQMKLTSGDLIVKNEKMKTNNDRYKLLKSVGIIVQDFALLEHLSIKENVLLALENGLVMIIY